MKCEELLAANGVDYAEAMERFGGNKELYKKIAVKFIDDPTMLDCAKRSTATTPRKRTFTRTRSRESPATFRSETSTAPHAASPMRCVAATRPQLARS